MPLYKNRAVVGFPFGLISATDGSAFTSGAPVGYYTLDGGTQQTITAAPVHEGNGQWSVNLTAAETNGDLVGLVFVCAGAIPVYFTIATSTLQGGAVTWVYNLTDSATGDPIPNADVWATTDAGGDTVVARGVTDAFGNVTFYLDAGTYYIWRELAGWTFVNPDIETVS